MTQILQRIQEKNNNYRCVEALPTKEKENVCKIVMETLTRSMKRDFRFLILGNFLVGELSGCAHFAVPSCYEKEKNFQAAQDSMKSSEDKKFRRWCMIESVACQTKRAGEDPRNFYYEGPNIDSEYTRPLPPKEC